MSQVGYLLKVCSVLYVVRRVTLRNYKVVGRTGLTNFQSVEPLSDVNLTFVFVHSGISTCVFCIMNHCVLSHTIVYQGLYQMSLVNDVLCFVSGTTTSLSDVTIFVSIISHKVSYQISLFSIRYLCVKIICQ